MGQLEDIQVFVRIVEAAGIGRAADQLNIAKSAVSRRLSDLEERLGTKLINRTTRRSSLTDAGRSYYQQALKVLDQVNEMNGDITASATNLTGTIRFAAPLSFGLLHLGPAIEEFSSIHPDLNIHIDFSDRQVDIIEEGFDVAFRIADLKDSSIQARKVFQSHHTLLASPAYLTKRGRPKLIGDLEHHDFLRYGVGSSAHWALTDSEGREHKITLQSKISANNGDFLLQMAKSGLGIVMLPTFIAWQALKQGELEKVLPNYQIPSLNGYCLYPKNRFLPARARMFIDFLVDRFETPYWDAELTK
ncbi:LysR family transcriptional regulator [Reinekea sp.]|jgi:DNA-binding transcriptional LysR family regulator|uniref:LysR family transcriptional regulator n=1 Tax=Reinekea sp. TaxID=1970455 RepID=UPI0039899085